MSLLGYRDPKDALKKLTKRKEEIEREFEALRKRYEDGEIQIGEFNEKRKKLEREFIEVMDRLAQLRYITGEGG